MHSLAMHHTIALTEQETHLAPVNRPGSGGDSGSGHLG